MRAKLLTLLAVLIGGGLAVLYDRGHAPAGMPAPAPAASAGQDLPAIKFTALDGKAYDLRALPERGIVLHFWASWCAPCALEFPPLLQKIADAHGKLALVAISIDDRREDMEKFLARLPKTHAPHVYWVWDGEKTISLKNFDTVRAPESVLIDAQRHMVDKIAGDPGWASPAMNDHLKRLYGP